MQQQLFSRTSKADH